MRPLAALVLLFASLAGLGTFAAAFTRPKPATTDPSREGRPRVKLAVLVVFDQMRGDYPVRWRSLYGSGGFLRLLSEGASFTDCHYPYATTTTGPGHASILTGTCPDRHGIVNNNWNEKGVDVYCAADARYAIVPSVIDPKTGQAGKSPAGGTPERLRSETVADVLKQTYGPKARVFGLSLKDRSAILPTGKQPDGAFWFDGRVVTSTYYTEGLDRRFPDWALAFNDPSWANRKFNQDWTRLRPDLAYSRFSGPDDTPGEGVGTRQGRTFPHPMNGGLKAPGKEFYDAFANSPYGNELLLALAKQCIVGEDLGRNEIPDLLVVSFSSNDLIGHTWGPDSQEVLDVTLRSDVLIADFLRFLDARVGAGNYALALTADHGICPLPEVSVAKGRDAKRVNRIALQKRAEQHLRERFSDVEVSEKTNWIETISFPWIYLNPRLVKVSGRSPDVVSGVLARFFNTQPDVDQAFTREELTPDCPVRSELHRRVKRSYYPERCGDVYLVLRPFDLPSDRKPTELLKEDAGTTHGSPHEYDAFVPLIVYGPGVPGGPRSEPVTPQHTAAIFSRFLGIRPPRDAEYPVPATLEIR